MKANELDVFISYYIFGNANSLLHKNKRYESKEKYFENLLQNRLKFNDIKSPLWLILSLKEKILMCVLQTNPIEFKLMVLMIWKERYFNSNSLK